MRPRLLRFTARRLLVGLASLVIVVVTLLQLELLSFLPSASLTASLAASLPLPAGFQWNVEDIGDLLMAGGSGAAAQHRRLARVAKRVQKDGVVIIVIGTTGRTDGGRNCLVRKSVQCSAVQCSKTSVSEKIMTGT